MSVTFLALEHLQDADPSLLKRFSVRIPKLLAIEGKYHTSTGKEIRLSCRWKDFLRAANSKHFSSCFKKSGSYSIQPLKRLYNPTWAVVFMPDRAGNIQCRVFVEYVNEKLMVSKIYGNGFNYKELSKGSLHDVIRMEEREDVYL